jgi:hypothetical protein
MPSHCRFQPVAIRFNKMAADAIDSATVGGHDDREPTMTVSSLCFTSALVAAMVCLAPPTGIAQQASQGTTKSAAKKPAPTPEANVPAPGGGHPTLLGQYGEWGAYVVSTGGKKICFALAKPHDSRTKPPNRPRDPSYLFVASRPAENVRNEVSVMIGYSFKPGIDASLEIGPAKFAMYTQSDGAWIKNAAEEARMVEAMRKGADVVVTGTSARGTQSTDRYSLKGMSQALDRASRECK